MSNEIQLPSALRNKKIAIVHDWLIQYGGAERLVVQMHRMFPDATVYTLLYDPKEYPEDFRRADIRTTYLQRIPFSTKLYKNFLTLMPKAFESLDLSEYDIVISSCTCCSKGVITRPDALHVCYCNTPTRYVWNFYHDYVNRSGRLKRLFIPGMIHKVRMWDYLAAQRVDHFIGNSREVASRIRKYYRREADVIHPGVCLNTAPLPEKPDDYYLMIGRLVRYKRFDLGVEACRRLGRRLIIIGTGEEEKKLRRMKDDNIEFRGNLTDEEKRELCLHAKAFLLPGEEDFGMTPVEAQSAGCPVLAYGRGGALDTVRDGESGLFFHEQTADSLCDCIERFERDGVTFTRAQIRSHARQFGEDRFRQQLYDYLTAKLEQNDNMKTTDL